MSRSLTRRGFCFLGGASALLPALSFAAPDDEPDGRASGKSTSRWAFFKDSWWYVPAANLRAYLYTPGSQDITFVTDQTVFHLTDYRRGYFWGVVGAKLASADITYSTLVGSVTPEGQVHLSFTPFDANSTSIVTLGSGTMEPRRGQWLMANQMSSGPSVGLQVFHWAYMVQTAAGRRSWESLPGVGMSVEEFMQNCPPGPELRVAG